MTSSTVEHDGDSVAIRVGKAGPNGIYVEDDGPGIPADRRDSVFEPGHTSEETSAGLGLTIVKRIVEAHDWEISVTDGRDGGVRFEIAGVEIIDADSS